MSKTAKLELDGKTYELPVVVGTEQEPSIDISALRKDLAFGADER